MDLNIESSVNQVPEVPGRVEGVVPPGHLEVLHQGLDLVVLDVPVEVPEGHDGVREGVDPINKALVALEKGQSKSIQMNFVKLILCR